MKKTILFILGLGCNILLSCYDGGIKDNKQPVGYSNYDTTKPMEHINSTADSAHAGPQ